jgi:hypothetical protein
MIAVKLEEYVVDVACRHDDILHLARSRLHRFLTSIYETLNASSATQHISCQIAVALRDDLWHDYQPLCQMKQVAAHRTE